MLYKYVVGGLEVKEARCHASNMLSFMMNLDKEDGFPQSTWVSTQH